MSFIRADRELGTLLKDSYIAYNRPASAIPTVQPSTVQHSCTRGCHGYAGTSASLPRELPKEMSLNLQLSGGAVDDKTLCRLKEKLPTGKDNLSLPEIARTLLQLFEMPNPSDYEARSLAELLEKENGIKRLSSEPFSVIPKKALDRLSTKCVLEFFKNKPLSSNEASALEKGVYTVTEADLILAGSQACSAILGCAGTSASLPRGNEAFWQGQDVRSAVCATDGKQTACRSSPTAA